MRMLMSMSFAIALTAGTEAADVCIRWHTGGTRDGTGWDTAYTNLATATYSRGDTLWFADTDGIATFVSTTFNKAVSGGTLVTCKKATIADHGPATGWNNSYGDGACVFDRNTAFTTSNWVLDGNGTHTIPTNHLGAYGFIIGADTDTESDGLLEFGAAATTVSNIVVKYTAVTNSVASEDADNNTVNVRFYPSLQHHHIALKNCWFKNSGRDGIQISDCYAILIERCWVERLGKLVDPNHGQAIQMFSGNFAAVQPVFRWNVFDSCEGQSLIAGPDDTHPDADRWERFRFYGNVIFHPFGTVRGAGFNSSGGIIGNAWDTGNAGLVEDGTGLTNCLIYNNTIVNLRDSYTTGATYTHFPVHAGSPRADIYRHNNLFYNCNSSSASAYVDSHNASGGLGTAGGTSEQTGLSSTIFVDYEGNDFRLASETDAPKDVTTIPGFDDSADPFFGQLDYNEDMYGNPFTSRGAFAFAEAAEPDAVTNIVSRISGPVTLSGKVVIQ